MIRGGHALGSEPDRGQLFRFKSESCKQITTREEELKISPASMPKSRTENPTVGDCD